MNVKLIDTPKQYQLQIGQHVTESFPDKQTLFNQIALGAKTFKQGRESGILTIDKTGNYNLRYV